MFWFLAGVAVVALIWVLAKSKKQPVFYESDAEFIEFVAEIRNRRKLLSDVKRRELILEMREMAFEGYDRLFAGALAAGKSESFAHQAGVLDAAYCVFANDDAMRKNDSVRRLMQWETVPFNFPYQHDGRAAIAEYLIWKVFPDDADFSKFMPIIDKFVYNVIEESKLDVNPKATVDLMLRSGQFDWHELTKIFLGEANHG